MKVSQTTFKAQALQFHFITLCRKVILYSAKLLYLTHLSFVSVQWMTLCLVNLELYVLSRSTNRLRLNFRWVRSKLGLTIEISVSLAQQNPASPSSCILISSKPTQGPRNPNQSRPGSSPNIPLHKPPFIPLMGMLVLKSKVNVGRAFYCPLSFDVLVHVVCVVRWPFATGRGDGKLLAQGGVQINMFHSP